MKEIVIISGKGGTGKTSITACIAAMAKNVVLADCDVDAPDLYLLTRPETIESFKFSGGKKARINEDCFACGKCRLLCHFKAIEQCKDNGLFKVNPFKCEGCGLCHYVCPADAVELYDAVNGNWHIAKTNFGPMVHAKLFPAEENSGKLVSLIRTQAKKIAEAQSKTLTIIDGPPGIGCPVVASITGADIVLIVAEPTISAIHDMQRVVELADKLSVKVAICVNRYDINPILADEITEYAKDKNLSMLGKIPFDKNFVKAQMSQQSLAEYKPDSQSVQNIKVIFDSLIELVN